MDDKYEIYNLIADWLEREKGYSFIRDSDGFWFEEEIREHRYKDMFELLFDFGEWAKGMGS